MDAQAQAVSPFLLDTNVQYAWDSTSLGYLKTCPRLYQYTMIEGWGHAEESVHLRFGTELHKALQEYEVLRAKGISREPAIREVVYDLLARTRDWIVDEDSRAGKYKNRASLIRAAVDYFDHYVKDAAQTYILPNGKPAVELSFRFELDWGPKFGYSLGTEIGPSEYEVKSWTPYLLCGHLDRVVTFNDDLYVLDLKTTTSTPGSYYFDQYHPSNQMTLYTLASQVILGTTVKGVIIEAAQIAIGFTRFTRGMTYRTPDQLEEWLADLRYWLALAEGYATEGYWPQNDTACDKFGGCRFREICSKSPQVRGQFLKSKFEQLPLGDRWNPLRSR